MDISETKRYYSKIKREDLCSCDWCQNYIDEIGSSYPVVSDYLKTLGVDIEKPFEVGWPLDPVDGYMEYSFSMYLIAGNSDGFKETKIGDVTIGLAESHPAATYKGEYFIIEAGPFHIKCRTDKYSFDE